MPSIVLDDRLLIEELLVGLDVGGERHITSYWYHRACRAAASGAGGHLSGPFLGLEATRQVTAIRSLLVLPDTSGLPDPQSMVPVMAELSDRHPCLNLLHLEAAAAGLVLDATILLSIEASRGVLPEVLDAESIRWPTIAIDGRMWWSRWRAPECHLASCESGRCRGRSTQEIGEDSRVAPRWAREREGALGPFDRGMSVTTSVFTRQAEEQASASGSTPIDLIDGERLLSLLVEKGLGFRTTTVIDQQYFVAACRRRSKTGQ